MTYTRPIFFVDDVPTAFYIEKCYDAMLSSVEYINNYVPPPEGQLPDPQILDNIYKDYKHLELMVSKDWWTGYDLTSINAAIQTGKNIYNSTT